MTYTVSVKCQVVSLLLVFTFVVPVTAQAVSFTPIGTFQAGDAIPIQFVIDPLPAGSTDYRLITFTEPVLLPGTLSAVFGDPDLLIYETTVNGNDASLDQLVASAATAGVEVFVDIGLSTGDYLLGVNAFEALSSGYTLSLETTQAPIPVPAAPWLFGSAIGMLGWRMHRKG